MLYMLVMFIFSSFALPIPSFWNSGSTTRLIKKDIYWKILDLEQNWPLKTDCTVTMAE